MVQQKQGGGYLLFLLPPSHYCLCLWWVGVLTCLFRTCPNCLQMSQAHDSFAHYKIIRTMMANKVLYKDEYYCHLNFVAVDTICSHTICDLFFAEVKLSQDAQNNEILACCVLSPQAWTGCLSCPSNMEILHPPPSEYNVGAPASSDVSSGSFLVGIKDQIFKEYQEGKTPSMAYPPVGPLYLSQIYMDSVEGAEIRACLGDHFKKTGEKYSYVKLITVDSIVPNYSCWKHYNFLAKRVDMSNAKVELLFAERQIFGDYFADCDSPSVCCSLGPARLVPTGGNFCEVGDFYGVTAPDYRRGIDVRQCFCSVRHPSHNLYTMHLKRPSGYQPPPEAETFESKAETSLPVVSEVDQNLTEAQICPSLVMRSNQPRASLPSSDAAELDISIELQTPYEDVISSGSTKRRKVDV